MPPRIQSNLNTTLDLGMCVILGHVYFKIQEVMLYFPFQWSPLLLVQDVPALSGIVLCPWRSSSVCMHELVSQVTRRWHIDDKL